LLNKLQNYIESYKQKAKITEEEEKRGRKILLKGEIEGVKSKSAMKARRDMASQKKFKMSLKKSYKSEYEHSEDS
jgi:hypothetical protein